jgi:ABC-type branched-subunit amino acid transport system substrate-binding protein
MIKKIRLSGPFMIIAVILAIQGEAFLTYSTEAGKDTVKIGLLIAENKLHAAEYGARLAINHANTSLPAGYTFKLIIKKMEGPWGTGSKEAVDLVFKEKVTAIITSVDGRNDHLAEQVSAKTHVPIISVWSADPTLGQAFVPWYFSCVPDNSQQTSFLVDEIYNKRKISKVAVVADNSYDSRSAASNFQKHAAFSGKPDPEIIYFDQLHPLFKEITEEIRNRHFGGVVILAKSAQVSELSQLLRKIETPPVIFTSLLLEGEEELSTKTLENIQGVYMISPGYMFNPDGLAFIQEFSKKFGYRPGAVAAYAYDGVSVLTDAKKRTVNDRSGLQDALMKTDHNGITGNIQFDKNGNRTGRLFFMILKEGKLVLLTDKK